MPVKMQGPRLNRLAVYLFSILFGLLIFWLSGFIIYDLDTSPGPKLADFEQQHIKPELLAQKKALETKLAAAKQAIKILSEQQLLLQQSSLSLQKTIDQLVGLQKLSLQKNVAVSSTHQQNISSSLQHFLQNQEKYQQLNQGFTQQVAAKALLSKDLLRVSTKIRSQRKPAKQEYQRAKEAYQLKMAFTQLAVVLPVLLISLFVLFKMLGSIYLPMALAFGGAMLLQTILIIHEHFPTRYFKYIFVCALILVIGRLLVNLLHSIAAPKLQTLLKRYHEAYEHFRCPACDYPTRIGPLKFQFWSRRSLKKAGLSAAASNTEEVYTCPACGINIFSNCEHCGKVRHSLLSFCCHCGHGPKD